MVCDPNKVKPFAPKCAAMCAGPVSFATTYVLSLISVASSGIVKALSLGNSKPQIYELGGPKNYS